MKMFLFVYADYLDESITNEFWQLGYKPYMKCHDVADEDHQCRARMSTDRPGKNISLFIVVPNEELPIIVGIVQRLKEKYLYEAFRAVTFPVEEYG